MQSVIMDSSSSTSPRGHALIVPYPAQGHINPMLQFAKRLAAHGLPSTLAATRATLAATTPDAAPVAIAAFSDGFDHGGFSTAPTISAYLDTFRSVGSATLSDLIISHNNNNHNNNNPITIIIYDPFLPWILSLAEKLALPAAAFFTQSCAVDAIFHHVVTGRLPCAPSAAVSLPGLPLLEPRDLPSYLTSPHQYPAYLTLILSQFTNLEKANDILINSFQELETKEFSWLKSLFPTVKTIGPTVPDSDSQYGFHLYKLSDTSNSSIVTWLKSKAKSSVVYVSFGSMAELTKEQMGEIAEGVKGSGREFLWVVRAKEMGKMPEGFVEETRGKGMVVNWCSQLEVLANPAVGCFVTHCGWNSTLEAIGLGVPMVGVPQWTDQGTNAKYVEDVWGVGVRVKGGGEGVVVGRGEVERCIREVMEGGRSVEIRENAGRWRDVGRRAVGEGGSSYENIVEFVGKYCK